MAKTTNRVEIELPRGRNEDKYIAVNGVAYIVPKKGRHEVPPEIAAEYLRGLEAEDARFESQDVLLKRAAQVP